MRRPIANAYSLAAILEMEANIDSCSRLFLSQMDQFASLGDAVDLGVCLLPTLDFLSDRSERSGSIFTLPTLLERSHSIRNWDFLKRART